MTDLSFDATAARSGARAVFALAAPGIPFGLVLGLAVSEGGLDRLAGWSSGWLMLAGAAQLAAIDLLVDGASAGVILATVALVNSRHAMYSAALRPKFADAPRWFRLAAPYVLIDQVFAVANALEDVPLRTRMWHMLGAGGVIWTLWQVAVGVGVLAGAAIPDSWSLDFTVPLMFGGLMLLSISDRPGVASALIGGVVAIVARDLPQGSGLLLAIVAGMAVGGILSERTERSGATRP
ncbi:MAG: AzlC family ABC transporter permease [Acidimicrobiales bacterium]